MLLAEYSVDKLLKSHSLSRQSH